MATKNYISRDSKRRSYLKRNASCHSSLEWVNSTETIDDLPHNNDLLPFSADEATSESEFDEHPYSVRKIQKTSRSNSPRYDSNVLHEGNESSSSSSRAITANDLNNRKSRPRPRQRKSKCESKNAVMARLNRLKKKMYVTDLENRNAKLEKENKKMKEVLHKKCQEVLSLKRESINLQSVIKNSTEIGSILQCIKTNTDLHVTSSLLNNQSTKKPLSSQSSLDRSTSDICLTSNDEGRIPEKQVVDFGNELHMSNVVPTSPSTENVLFNDCLGLSFGIDSTDNDFLSDLQGEAFISEIFQDANLKSDHKSFDVEELVRCETPSKDLNISLCNNDLFNDVGVCFHIANKRVSLEFCDACNRKAAM